MARSKKSTNTAEELTNVTPRVLLTTAVEIWPAHRLRHPRPPPLAEEFIRMPKKTRGHKATRVSGHWDLGSSLGLRVETRASRVESRVERDATNIKTIPPESCSC